MQHIIPFNIMAKHFKTILFILFAFTATIKAQTKIIAGEKHTLSVDVPKNWVLGIDNKVPFFIKPDMVGGNDLNYIYVYGIDYEDNPNMDQWIDGNNDYMKESFPGIKIDTLKLSFPNIKKDDYATGRYNVVTYLYPDGKKEALLIIECTHTIATVVMSSANASEFEKYLPSFKEIGSSVKILGTSLKE